MKSTVSDRPVIDSPSDLLARASAAGNDFPKGLRLAEQAVTLARRDGAGDEVLGQALLLQAHFAWRLFDYALAYESALDASSVLERCGDERRRSRALNYCFIVCIETGDLVRAIEHSTRALALAQADQHPGQRATLLHNQAVVYEMIEDYDTALSCLAESAQLYDRLVQGEAGAFFARVNAAGIHLARADRAAGRDGEVQAHRDAARAALPALRTDADPAALQMWLSIQSRLGDMAAARDAAVLCIARARANPASERYKTYALLALADYHLGLGHRRRGVACLRRAADKLRAAQNQSHLSATERRLAALYAEMGDHDSALQWIRRAHADNTRMQAERHMVRWSFAEADRDEKRRRELPQEVLVHAQRLDVVGRLIAEIHHALAPPLNVARARLLSLLDDDGEPRQLEQGLSEVIAQVDAAASLVGQLKMFSYRASPQPSELNPQAALAQAWQDAALWRHGPPRELRIDSRVRMAVHVDAQRLAVLLRILLIEADRTSAPADLAATIDAEDAMCRMRIATTAQALDQVSAGVGITLCAEIAGEVGGRLSFDLEAGRVVFDLRLPLLRNL